MGRRGRPLLNPSEASRAPAFVRDPGVLNPDEASAATRAYLMHIGGGRPPNLANQEHQARIDPVVQRLFSAVTNELAQDPSDFIPGIAAIERDPLAHETSPAFSFENGSIVVLKPFLGLAQALGGAIAAATDERSLIANLIALSRGEFKLPPTVSASDVAYYADSVVAFVIAHEMVHSLKNHPARGTITDDPTGDPPLPSRPDALTHS